MWKWKPDIEFQYGGRLGEFNGILSHSHVSHCRVLPLGEFTITIPEPHATLQGAVTWGNQCRDRATLQGVRIPSGILKIFFRHMFFVLMQFRLWRAAAFVSSPIHLFHIRSPDVSSIASIPWRDIVSNLFIHSFTLYFILLYFDFFVLIGSMLVTQRSLAARWLLFSRWHTVLYACVIIRARSHCKLQNIQ